MAAKGWYFPWAVLNIYNPPVICASPTSFSIAPCSIWKSRSVYYEAALDWTARVVEVILEWAKEASMAIEYIQTGKPNQDACIERFNRTLREEILDACLFVRLDDVREGSSMNRSRPEWLIGPRLSGWRLMAREIVRNVAIVTRRRGRIGYGGRDCKGQQVCGCRGGMVDRPYYIGFIDHV